MDKQMTTEDLFMRIKDILHEKGRPPDILNYGLGAYRLQQYSCN